MHVTVLLLATVHMILMLDARDCILLVTVHMILLLDARDCIFACDCTHDINA